MSSCWQRKQVLYANRSASNAFHRNQNIIWTNMTYWATEVIWAAMFTEILEHAAVQEFVGCCNASVSTIFVATSLLQMLPIWHVTATKQCPKLLVFRNFMSFTWSLLYARLILPIKLLRNSHRLDLSVNSSFFEWLCTIVSIGLRVAMCIWKNLKWTHTCKEHTCWQVAWADDKWHEQMKTAICMDVQNFSFPCTLVEHVFMDRIDTYKQSAATFISPHFSRGCPFTEVILLLFTTVPAACLLSILWASLSSVSADVQLKLDVATTPKNIQSNVLTPKVSLPGEFNRLPCLAFLL